MPVGVADASILLKWILPEPGHKEALALLAEWVHGRIELIAPRLAVAEAASALCKKVRRKHLTTEAAAGAFALLSENHPELFDDDLPAALTLALRHQMSFWDAVYVALAIERRCDLITADRRLYSAASSCYPHVQMLGEEV